MSFFEIYIGLHRNGAIYLRYLDGEVTYEDIPIAEHRMYGHLEEGSMINHGGIVVNQDVDASYFMTLESIASDAEAKAKLLQDTKDFTGTSKLKVESDIHKYNHFATLIRQFIKKYGSSFGTTAPGKS